VIIDAFAPEGDVLAPSVTAADSLIRDADEVLVSGPGAMTTRRAAMPGGEMMRSAHGVAVLVRKVKRL
jgi:predicted RNA-binding protein